MSFLSEESVETLKTHNVASNATSSLRFSVSNVVSAGLYSTQSLNYSTKGLCFPEKQQHDWRYVYVCTSYRKLYACIRIILHSLKYHITKVTNRKNDLSALGRMQRLDLSLIHI